MPWGSREVDTSSGGNGLYGVLFVSGNDGSVTVLQWNSTTEGYGPLAAPSSRFRVMQTERGRDSQWQGGGWIQNPVRRA